MSRIAKVPIDVPQGLQVSVDAGVVTLKGPKGESKVDTKGDVSVKLEDGKLLVERPDDSQQARAKHGLYHRLLTGAIRGLTDGYKIELEMHGVGYRGEMRGPNIVLQCGFTHPVIVEPPTGVTIATTSQTAIVVSGVNRQAVGQTAAKIRAAHPPEPYKGKGVRYKNEQVRRKVGKSGSK